MGARGVRAGGTDPTSGSAVPRGSRARPMGRGVRSARCMGTASAAAGLRGGTRFLGGAGGLQPGWGLPPLPWPRTEPGGPELSSPALLHAPLPPHAELGHCAPRTPQGSVPSAPSLEDALGSCPSPFPLCSGSSPTPSHAAAPAAPRGHPAAAGQRLPPPLLQRLLLQPRHERQGQRARERYSRGRAAPEASRMGSGPTA